MDFQVIGYLNIEQAGVSVSRFSYALLMIHKRLYTCSLET